jgi:hypothetical protein
LFLAFISICFAVECKKPWHYLASTVNLKGRKKSITFPSADGTATLLFQITQYNKKFGQIIGQKLYYSFNNVLEKTPTISSDEVKTQISVMIWKQFGIKWLLHFKCNKDFVKVTPPQGDLIFFHVFTEHVSEISYCFTRARAGPAR